MVALMALPVPEPMSGLRTSFPWARPGFDGSNVRGTWVRACPESLERGQEDNRGHQLRP